MVEFCFIWQIKEPMFSHDYMYVKRIKKKKNIPHNMTLFSSPVQKDRNSYCNHTSVGISVAVSLESFYKSTSLEHVHGSS